MVVQDMEESPKETPPKVHTLTITNTLVALYLVTNELVAVCRSSTVLLLAPSGTIQYYKFEFRSKINSITD